jgi:IclR helix-turn-helix domain
MTTARDQATCAYPPHPASRLAAEVPPAPDPAASRLARWFGHAPAERVPAIAVPAVWTAAEITHVAAQLGHFTPAAVVVSAAATLAAAGTGYGLGTARASGEHQRLTGAELAAGALVTGGWFTAAAGLGPLAGPGHLLSLLYAAGAAGGYAWLRTHEAVRGARDRRAQAAAEAADLAAKRAEWHRLAVRAGLHGSHLMKPEPNNNGEVWVIDTYSAGVLASRVNCDELAQRLAGERGVRKGRVEVAPDPEWVYRLRILFREDDPWKGGSADAFIWHPWASGTYDPDTKFAGLVPPAATIRDPVVIGVDPEAGTPLAFPLWDEKGAKRILVLAASGEGKSMLLDTIRERVTACDDARLLQINLSKGVEDSWWEPLTEASALASDSNPPARAQAILDFAMAVVDHRKNAPARKAGARSHQPSPGEPLFVLMVDEVDKVIADPDRKQALEMLESKCRSEGWALIMASQRAVQGWVSTSLRANLTHFAWSKMRMSDLRAAMGGDFDPPDMGAYGGNNKGIFAVCEMPAYRDMPYLRGRTFFWGNESPGLVSLVADRAAGRQSYVLEPALASSPAAPLWAQITGAAPLDAARYDVTATRDGETVPGMEGPRAKFAAARDLLNGTRRAASEDEDLGDADDAPLVTDQATGARVSPDAAAVLVRLRAAPGGMSARALAEALPWQKTKVHVLLAELAAAGLVRVAGEGRTACFVAVAPVPAAAAPGGPYPPLHLVPDPAEDVS